MFANSAAVKYHTLGGFDKIYFSRLWMLKVQSQDQAGLTASESSLPGFCRGYPSSWEIWLGLLRQLF